MFYYMKKYITKFEAFDSSNLHNLFKEENLKVSDLNSMIDNLEKYNLDRTLLAELKRSKLRNYTDLRKWKIDSILTRYNNVYKIINKLELIEDYFLELTDNGYRIATSIVAAEILNNSRLPTDTERKALLHDSNKYRVIIYTKGVNKSRLDRIAEVSGFLKHLNTSKRLDLDIESIQDSNEFRVIVNSILGDNKYAQDEDEDYDIHRAEREHNRSIRNLRRGI